jgi:carboxypeptidase C (cathepsin A)
MMIKFKKIATLLIVAVSTQSILLAQEPSKENASSKEASSIVKEEKSITKHTVVIGGKTINYTATAGALILRNNIDEPIAFFGYTAYTKDGEEATKRPITFSYNGGPGSSSMWLHMGVMGPKRVVVNDPNDNAPAPYKVEDNQYSILDNSDVVMIDPVGTGISRAIGKTKNEEYWSVNGDLKSVGDFIKQYLIENDRLNSPKFLLGESYGTMRSAAVGKYLQGSGIALNGIILLSSVLDLRTLTFQDGDDLSYIINLPAYAATAWYHNKVPNKPAQLSDFLQKARDYAAGNYTLALMKGSKLSKAEKEKVANELASLTGLSAAYILRADLRVKQGEFCQELLREEHLTTGRLDSRYKGINADLLSQSAGYDPQSAALSPIYISAFMNYYYGELKVSKGLTYRISAGSLPGFKWDWKHNTSGFGDAATPNTAIDLADAMTKNPNLKVLVLNGYYDLATPFYGTEYTFDHMGLEDKILANVKMKYYESGHMVYVHPASATAFKKDVTDFIKENSGIK